MIMTVQFPAFRIPHLVNLADPEFKKERNVDMDLGSQVFLDLMRDGIYS